MYTHGAIMVSSLISRVFMNGNSQAVRIPQEFRFDTAEVEISRNADGDLVIHPLLPLPKKRCDALFQALAGFDPEFLEILEADRQEPLESREREPL
jgi:antitoxin VapB